jgi:hypothetical protein
VKANKTAELVKLWAEFEQTHPNSSIDDFCRYYLITSREKENKQGFLKGNVPPGIDQTLIKLMGTLGAVFEIYASNALKAAGVNQLLEFVFLNTVDSMQSPKKTEVIYANYAELSSGLLVIDRLKKRGYLSEYSDTQDKRSKRLVLTDTGREVLYNCYMILMKLCSVFLSDMSEDDIKLCVSLLLPVEIKYSALWQKHKNMPFEQVYEEMMDGKQRI